MIKISQTTTVEVAHYKVVLIERKGFFFFNPYFHVCWCRVQTRDAFKANVAQLALQF